MIEHAHKTIENNRKRSGTVRDGERSWTVSKRSQNHGHVHAPKTGTVLRFSKKKSFFIFFFQKI
jgi:hypothetical protein